MASASHGIAAAVAVAEEEEKEAWSIVVGLLQLGRQMEVALVAEYGFFIKNWR